MTISKGLDRAIRSHLASGEHPLIVTSLRIPKQFTAAASWFSVLIFIRAFDELRNGLKMRALRRQFEEIQFPIARRMTVCVTQGRLLIFKRSNFRPSKSFLGAVDRSRVTGSVVSRTNHVKWRIVTIQLREGIQFRLVIDHEAAEPFSELFNAGPQ